MRAGRYLLDTHAVLWAFYAPHRLSVAAREIIGEAEALYVSIITFWEIALKFSRGGFGDLAVPETWEKSLIGEMETQGFHLLTVETRHCRMVQDLPKHHKDPFDRMLIAQALSENLELVSCDSKMDGYEVRRVW